MNDLQRESGLSDEQTARWTRVGTLAALAMVLGYLETFIPIPIPGVKLGLANIAVIIALARGDTGGALCISVIKVLSAGFLFGNPVTMAYSAIGTLFAFAVMAPLSRIRGLSIVLVSISGALAHEAGQLVVAMALLGTPLVWYSAPLLGLAGCATGLLCGIVAKKALALRPEEENAGEDGASVGEVEAGVGAQGSEPRPLMPARQVDPRIRLDARVIVVAFLVYAVVVLRLSSTHALIAALAIALAACIAGRVPPRSLARTLRPTLAILLITLIAQIASSQQGEVLFEVGTIAITREGLEQTWVMMARLISLVGASVAVMFLAAPSDLVDALFWYLAPLRNRGLRTEGFALALNVALAYVPTLLAAIEGRRLGAKEWMSSVAQFIANHVN